MPSDTPANPGAGEVFCGAPANKPPEAEPLPSPLGGRPPHIRSEAIAYEIELSAASLIPQEHIAALVGISRPTLQKYYLQDWERGKARAAKRVALKLNGLLEKNDDKAILHLAKVVLGLTEVKESKVEVTNNTTVTLDHYMAMPIEDLRRRIVEIDEILDADGEDEE